MALPASAAFTGTNGTLINSLADWDGAGGYTNSNGLDIQSNAAQANNTGGAYAQANWWTTDSFNAAQYSEATVTSLTAGVYVGVAVRCGGTDAGSNMSGYLFYSDSGDSCYLEKWVNGSIIATLTSGSVFAVNDVIRIEITSGNVITCKVNGTTRLTHTDSSSPIASGAAGICAYGDGTSRIDNWEGGNITTPGKAINRFYRKVRFYRKGF